MELIWSTVLTVWGWLLDHLLYINLAFSIIIIFFSAQGPQKCLDLASGPVLHPGVRNRLLPALWPGYEEEQDVPGEGSQRQAEPAGQKPGRHHTLRRHAGGNDGTPCPETFKSLIIYNLETSGSVLTVNNQVQIYTDGQAKFEALRNALRQARRFIHIQYYIIKNDELFDSIVPHHSSG